MTTQLSTTQDLLAEYEITPERELWLFRNFILGDDALQSDIQPVVEQLYHWQNPLEALYAFLFPDYEHAHEAWVVREMLAFLWAHQQESFQLGPRGWSKSDARTVTPSVYELVRGPNTRIGLTSKTFDKAKDLGRGVKNLLAAERTTQVFGKQQGARWGEEGFMVAGRTAEHREPSLTPIGIDRQIASAHYDMLICDDIADENNSRTQVQREHLHTRFYKELLPTLVSGGKNHSQGTRQHPSDIYGGWLKEGGLFAHCYSRIPAINEDGESNWPSRYPLEDEYRDGKRIKGLNTIRVESGPAIFEAQYQNLVHLMEGQIIKNDWIDDYQYDCEPSRLNDFFLGKEIYVGVDLAISRERSADFFAIVTVAVDPATNDIFVGPIFHDHLSFRGQTQKIWDTWQRWQRTHLVRRVGIEKNQYQAAQVQAVNELGHIGAVGIHVTKDKETRLLAVSGLFEAGKVHFWRGRNTDIIQELLAFPSTTEKDDLVDALVLAIEMVRNYDAKPFGLRI